MDLFLYSFGSDKSSERSMGREHGLSNSNVPRLVCMMMLLLPLTFLMRTFMFLSDNWSFYSIIGLSSKKLVNIPDEQIRSRI